MIPILIASDEKTDLVDLVDEIGERGQKIGLLPYLVCSIEEAAECCRNSGPRLMLTILGIEGQETHDKLVSLGYRGTFLVCDKDGSRKNWGDRKVEFIDFDIGPAQVYARIEEKLVE